MKAKDTVMTAKQLQVVVTKYVSEVAPIQVDCTDSPLHQRLREAQAEISFKAGYKQAVLQNGLIYDKGRKAGIREVVEWVKENCNKVYILKGGK